jgi:transposase-like protein
VREFAERHGLDAQRLYRWRAQLASPGSPPAPPFVEIKRSSSSAIEVVLRSGHVVRVQEGFGEDAFRRVVAVLEAADTPC